MDKLTAERTKAIGERAATAVSQFQEKLRELTIAFSYAELGLARLWLSNLSTFDSSERTRTYSRLSALLRRFLKAYGTQIEGSLLRLQAMQCIPVPTIASNYGEYISVRAALATPGMQIVTPYSSSDGQKNTNPSVVKHGPIYMTMDSLTALESLRKLRFENRNQKHG